MTYPMVLLVASASVLLILLGDWQNGQVYTETETIGGFGYFLTRAAKAISVAEKFLLLVMISHPAFLAVALGGFLGDIVHAVGAFGQALTAWWWLFLIVPAVTACTGFLAKYLVQSYSMSRFGSSKPDYNNWPEFSERAEREHTSTNVWINTHSWSPIRRVTKPSLSKRASSRSPSSVRHSGVILPVSMRSGPSLSLGSLRHSSSGGSSSVRHSGGGKKGGSSGGSSGSSIGKGCGPAIGTALTALASALQAILMVLVQILILAALLGVAVLYAYIAYKTTDVVMDHFDEEVLIQVE